IGKESGQVSSTKRSEPISDGGGPSGGLRPAAFKATQGLTSALGYTMIAVSLLVAAIISFCPQLVHLPVPKPIIGLLLAAFAAYRWQGLQRRPRLLAATENEPGPGPPPSPRRPVA